MTGEGECDGTNTASSILTLKLMIKSMVGGGGGFLKLDLFIITNFLKIQVQGGRLESRVEAKF